jgi:hypothetical protein
VPDGAAKRAEAGAALLDIVDRQFGTLHARLKALG